MHRILKLPSSDRMALFDETNRRTGLSQRSLEKDLWVCWTLRELFSLPGVGEHLFFKGGTSLSKAWGLIDRFSEDIDMVVDRAYLGFGGSQGPEHAASGNNLRSRLDDLRAVCRKCIAKEINPPLAESLRALSPEGSWNLESDAADVDGQTLLLHYPSEYSEDEYMRSTVKIELGARSDVVPFETPGIRPYVAEAFPELPGSESFAIRAVSPRRTFWEKAMLLHEETYRPEGKPRKIRLARHYYDLWCLSKRVWRSRLWPTRACSSAWPPIAKYFSVGPGWTTTPCGRANCACCHWIISAPNGPPITRPCGNICFLTKARPSKKSSALSEISKESSTKAHKKAATNLDCLRRVELADYSKCATKFIFTCIMKNWENAPCS